jgi:hypothetical protein
MTEQENDENFKTSMELIEKWGEENKPPSLRELFEEWYISANFCQSKHVIANELCDIVKKWMPKEDPRPSYDTMQWNKCVRRMKENLR